MWTYLAIFFSLAVLAGIFVRRVFYYYKEKKGGPEPGADKLVREKEEEAIEDKLKKLSRADKKSVEELCEKAESKLKRGNEDEAIKFFVQALAVDDLHIEAQHKLAMLYMKKQMFSAAAALFKNLGELTREAVHYSHLGLALYRQSSFEEARDAYQKAVDLDPSRPQRFVSLAQVYRSLGQLHNTAVALNKAIEIDKENMDYLFLLVDVQAEMGNFDEAIEILNQILEMEPGNEEAMRLLKGMKTKSVEKGEE
jgi:tetratricopeptide (TPR) repeat protein